MKNSIFNILNILISKGLVTEDNVKTVQQKYQDDNNVTIEDALIRENIVSEKDVYSTVAERMRLAFIDLKELQIDESLYDIIPQNLVEDYGIAPIAEENGRLIVATSNPMDYRMISVISNNIKRRIKTVVATPTQIKEQQDIMYKAGEQEKMYDEAQEFIRQQMVASEDSKIEEDNAEDQPIIKLVNKMFEDAVAMKASDLHIEPQEEEMIIRFRIDGKLREYTRVSRQLAPSIISRIKFISGMNIAEKRIPQDGRLHYNVNRTKIDMRVSDLPGVFGEKIVIRITTALGMKLELSSIGFLDENRAKFE